MLMVSELLGAALGGEHAVVTRTPARYGENRQPLVVWNVCRQCNMTCPHCYISAGPNPSRAELDTNESKVVLDELARAGVRVVIFSGGEPLLRADLFELLEHARAVGIAAQLSSNGVLIDASVASRLAAAGVGYVGISIDGRREFNDEYRGLRGGFERAVTGLRHARAAGLRTGLRTTLTRENQGELEAMVALAAQEADRFYLSHLVYAGRARRLMRHDLAPSETRQTLFRLFEMAERLRETGAPLSVVVGANDSAGPLLLGWIRERHGALGAERVERLLRARGGNSAGERLLCIDYRGVVHPDQFWHGAELGRVPAQRFSLVLEHPLRAKLASRTRWLEGRCGACRFKDLCGGSHRERALAATGNMWGPDPACVLTDDEVLGRLEGVA